MVNIRKLLKRSPHAKADATLISGHGLVVQSQDAQTMLALGLAWAPEISATGRHAAESAQKAKSTHMLKAPGMTAHVRLTGLPKKQTQQIYAAALIAAQKLGQADGTFALTIPTGQIWVAILSAGMPTSEQLLDPATAIRNANGWSGTLFTDVSAMPGKHVEHFEFGELFGITPPGYSMLSPVPRRRLMADIPKPVLWVIGAGLIYLGQSFALEQWQTSTRIAAQAQASAQRLQQQEDAKVAWRTRVKNELALKSQQVDLAELLQSINKMPVLWQGWTLESASCEAQALQKVAQATSTPVAEGETRYKKTWQCVARYTAPDPKQGIAITPNNALVAPPAMAIEHSPTKRTSLVWQIDTSATPLTLAQLPSQDHHRVTTSSILQANAAALATLPDIVLSAWRIEAPKIDGIATPMPADLILPLSAPLNIKGSLPVITRLQSQLKADWQKLVITASQDQVGIEADLTGVLYAK